MAQETVVKLVTCNNCSWVHFPRPLDEVIEEVNNFNKFYYAADEFTQSHYSGPSSILNYTQCFRCGNDYKDFHDYDKATDHDVFGSTIQPILTRFADLSGDELPEDENTTRGVDSNGEGE